MSSQLSPDRHFYWDGTKWVSTVSPDGAWRWDGTAWRPSRSRRSGMTGGIAALIAAGVIAVLLVAGVGAFGAVRLVTGANSGFRSVFGAVCSGPGALAGQQLREGGSLCGRKLGTQLINADCTTAQGLPDGIDANIANEGGDWTTADVPVDATGCELTAQPQQILAIGGSDIAPPDVVVVADFVPTGTAGDIGLRLACIADGCVDVSLYPDSSGYSLDEGAPNNKWKNIASGPLLFATVWINRPNRFALRFAGGVATVFLNGFEVAHGSPTATQVAGFVGFYIDNHGTTGAENVQLQRMYVFQAP